MAKAIRASSVGMCWPTKAMTVSPYASTATDTACGRSFLCARCIANLGRVCCDLFDKPQYKKRNAIERLFSWLKEKRRLCTRYDKLASSFKAMGYPGLHRKMLTSRLFRQNLGLLVPYWPMNGKFCIHQKTAIKRFL